MQNSNNYIKTNAVNKRNSRIIISRTDNIGDVVLALPMAGVIKKAIPGAYIIFLGKSYTADIIKMSSHIDEFVDWDSIKNKSKKEQVAHFKELKADYIIHVFPVRRIARIASLVGIPRRIGTTNRWFHWTTCNRLIALSRRRSNLHEAQLNLKLLKWLGISRSFPLHEIPDYYSFTPSNQLSEDYRNLLTPEKFNLILHPKSKGSAREWGYENFSELIRILPTDKFTIFISGTQEDAEDIKQNLSSKHSEVIDVSGKFTLESYISFIANADGLVACSTGPLHIAAALGKVAIGIYPPIKPMHPGRWAPLGVNASVVVADKSCNKCRKSSVCECISGIQPCTIKEKLMEIFSPNAV